MNGLNKREVLTERAGLGGTPKQNLPVEGKPEYARPLSDMTPLKRVPDEAGPPGQMRDGVRDFKLENASHLARDLKWAKTRRAVLYITPPSDGPTLEKLADADFKLKRDLTGCCQVLRAHVGLGADLPALSRNRV